MAWPHMDVAMVFWIVIGVIAVSAIYFRYKASISRDRTLQIMAEKGQAIPPEFFHHHGVPPDVIRHHAFRRHHGPLRAGIILMCIGVGIFVFVSMRHFGAGTPPDIGRAVTAGVFPFLIGVAFVLISLVDRRPPPPPPPPER